jgi:hypothetical protein
MLGLGSNLVTGGAPSEWTPASLGSALKAWFKNGTDILEGVSDPAEDGDSVTQWSDQSGNDNHLTAPNNYFTYDAATGGVESGDTQNDKLYLTNQLILSGEFALYTQVSFSTISTGANDLFFYDKDSASTDFFRIQSTTEVRGKINNGTVRKWTQATQSVDTFYNFGIERNASNNLFAYRDGSALEATTTVSDTGVLDIDAVGGTFDGIIKEIIICNSSLSSSDRTALQTYLANI